MYACLLFPLTIKLGSKLKPKLLMLQKKGPCKHLMLKFFLKEATRISHLPKISFKMIQIYTKFQLYINCFKITYLLLLSVVVPTSILFYFMLPCCRFKRKTFLGCLSLLLLSQNAKSVKNQCS